MGLLDRSIAHITASFAAREKNVLDVPLAGGTEYRKPAPGFL